MNHEFFMKKCIMLAKKSLGETSPNPYVGCVIVKNGKIIAEGFHKKSGEPHAEIEALNHANEPVEGATLYSNLEPCCHKNKKTPPCTQRIIKEGIKRVVIANLDPNEFVSGKGIQELRDAGLEVITDVLKVEGEILNEVFFTNMTKKSPFIHIKWAQTLDGKIATNSYHSKWITNEESRKNSHRERSLYDAIVVGENTINFDNPALTTRLSGTVKCNKRIIISKNLDLKKESHVFNDDFAEQTLIISNKEINVFDGITNIYCPLINDQFDLTHLLNLIYEQGIKSLYIEGGMQIISSFIEQNLYDRLSIYMAPKLLGAGIHFDQIQKSSMSDAIEFEFGHWQKFQNDMLFESRINICLQD